MTYTAENFINWCDDMTIANEEFDGSKIKDMLDRALTVIIETFQKLFEKFRRMMLTYQQKMNGNKYIKIPKVYHREIQEFKTKVLGFWDYDPHKLTDENITAIKKDWADLKNDILNDKKQLMKEDKEYAEQSGILANELYTDMKVDSRNISGALDYAKKLRSQLSSMKSEEDVERQKDYIHKLKNEIELSKMFIDIGKFYLSFEFIDEKGVGPENPETQVVTKQEREESQIPKHSR